MNLIDTLQAFLDLCLMVALSSVLAAQLVGRIRFQCLSRDRHAATPIPPNPFGLGIRAV
ncbi:MAG: hypothetical protein RIE73_33450 [Coleofasciculus sp. C1-SOL-03]